MSILIGLTGPTGAGKSSMAVVARKFGVKVVDCDLLAREAVLPGTDGFAALQKAFGPKIVKADGTLDRKALAAEAFSTPQKTELLNQTLLPHIATLVKRELNAERVLLDAPTLFESGLDALCDQTVAVLADERKRLARITERDGISTEEAKLRMNAGKPNAYYIERADHILYNNDGPIAFEFEAAGLLKTIFGGN